MSNLITLVLRFRLPLILSINILSPCLSYVLALGLRFDFAAADIFVGNRLYLPLSILISFRFGTYIYFGLNNGHWRYVSIRDLLTILKAHTASSLLFAALVGMLRLPAFPRSVIIIEFGLSILFSGGIRLLVRIAGERNSGHRRAHQTEREVVILGAGDSGHLLAKNLLHRKIPYKPVAVLDDSERLWGSNVHGIPIIGPISGLDSYLVSNCHVCAAIVAIPSLPNSRFKDIESTCKSHDVAVKRLQAFEDIACLDGIRPPDHLSIESVLEKDVHIEHEAEIFHALKGKRILVTGAGGSIGSELVRQLLPFGPSSLILLDHSEYNLFQVEHEFRDDFQRVTKRFVLASICNEQRLNRVFSDERPQIVFHAAAYKHVPLMEENCFEAFNNNVLGTRNLIELSIHFEAEHFVLISTDKAVDPSSVMGCSKRVAEMLVQTCSRRPVGRQARGTGLSTAVVRFGNVINSAGSVIPLFKRQILSGGPLTVTHPDMERYFMSIREAVRLVLTAGTLGEDGEIYILDMGKPIRVVDVAKKMRALYGRRETPIIFTGIRPGEKLKEELTSPDEEKSATRFNKVSRVTSRTQVDDGILWRIALLEDSLPKHSDLEIRDMLHELVMQPRYSEPERPPADAARIADAEMKSRQRGRATQGASTD